MSRNDPLTSITTRHTPQSEQADPCQARNAAGGFVYQTSTYQRIHRFLTLGTDGGTYYATEQALTKDNAAVILDAARTDAQALVTHIVQVSTAGRAPRNNPAIFALAVASALGDDLGRRMAYDALAEVCRTGTHLFTWAGYREQFAGWSRGSRRAVASWYLDKPTGDLAYQAVKYRQRSGWSHRDLLRLAHPKPVGPGQDALLRWIVRNEDAAELPPLVSAFAELQAGATQARTLELIEQLPISWEMLPDAALKDPVVWEALINKGMPQTALMRQLPRLTGLGLFGAYGANALTERVVSQLADPERLRRGRVHPVNVLVAARTYAAGRSDKHDRTWTPIPAIIDALDAAFYAAFGAIEPASKRTLVALDVSGSMTSRASGLPISCREIAAALAMVILATEPQAMVVGYTAGTGGYHGSQRAAPHELIPGLSLLPLSRRQRLDDVLRTTRGLSFGGTDCALPLVWAKAARQEFDTVISITDNETWAGPIHPHQALAGYRQQAGIPTRLGAVALTPTGWTIADPADPGQLDVSGFDSAVPNLLADFSRGDV